MPDSPSVPKLSAIDKAVLVLTSFEAERHTGLGVTELAHRSGLPKSTTFRVLTSLSNNGVVERVGERYRLGKVIQELAHHEETHVQELIRDVLTPYLADLFSRTKQTVHLAVLDDTQVVYLNKLYGHMPARSPSRIGGRVPAYCTAVGKVLLAHNPEAVTKILESPLQPWTPSTITDPVLFRKELEQVRQQNIAYDRGEILRTLNCVAAPIYDTNRRPVAALSISGPIGRFTPEHYATLLRQVCFEATRALGAALNARSGRTTAS
ncbi:IclR family transcriptional regulator [Rothia nasisuis]|uniref:IclR family transcriptional regulator n=1 Tax=Rothia nasisuis TaxID=2109647 RepID=UPI001F2FCD60|nr:IclR family transcriptional regulator [Rothia nasisuis]